MRNVGSSSDTLTSAQPTNRMDSSTKWFVIGLVCFAVGSMFLAGYFFTPGQDQDGADIVSGPRYLSDRHYAMPLGVSLMVFGFLVVLGTLCN